MVVETTPSFLECLAATFDVEDADATTMARLQDKWAAAVDAWPALTADASRFVDHLAQLNPGGSDLAAIEALHWSDLLLACECLAGTARALVYIDATFGAGVEQVAKRVRGVVEPPEQFRRQLWTTLIEPRSGRAPRLAGYSGVGSLAAWLRVIAVRSARQSSAEARRGPEIADGAELGVGPADPELAYLKALYRDEFKRAFGDAAEALSTRERNLLRHAIIDGLNVDQIGRIYHVHRATAARQLDRARTRLRTETHRLLMQRLGVESSALRSLSRLVASQLDVSVRRVLTRPGPH